MIDEFLVEVGWIYWVEVVELVKVLFDSVVGLIVVVD